MLNAESNEYIALINYANTIRSALKEVDDLLATAATNTRTEEIQQRDAGATRAPRSTWQQLEYREGSANGQELRDAQRSLFTAEDSALAGASHPTEHRSSSSTRRWAGDGRRRRQVHLAVRAPISASAALTP